MTAKGRNNNAGARRPAKRGSGKTKAARPEGRLRRWLRRAAIAGAILCLIPPALTLVYAIPAIHPVSTLMVGATLTGQGYQRDWIELEDAAPVLLHSIVMSEDGQFCRHYGIDWGELNAVIDDALEGAPVRGASTIPMQLAKNLFLWPGRSYLRKALEAPLALMLDAMLSKRRLMEIYINIAETGPGIYGVEAGARDHFGRSAAALTRRQAALLTVALPNPHLRDPARPGRAMSRVARVVERRARIAGDYVQCLE